MLALQTGDKEDPFQFSNARKALICGVTCLQISWITTISASLSPLLTGAVLQV